MARKNSVFLIFFLSSLFSFGQVLNEAFQEVYFEKSTYNFGLVDRTKGTVEKEILLVNGTKKAVDIVLSNTNCFCLTATPSEKKIKGDGSIKVNLRFNTN